MPDSASRRPNLPWVLVVCRIIIVGTMAKWTNEESVDFKSRWLGSCSGCDFLIGYRANVAGRQADLRLRYDDAGAILTEIALLASAARLARSAGDDRR